MIKKLLPAALLLTLAATAALAQDANTVDPNVADAALTAIDPNAAPDMTTGVAHPHGTVDALAKNMIYLLAAILFVFGLKLLSSPRTARKGNFVASFGMLVAVAITLYITGTAGIGTIIAGLVVGGAIGMYLAKRVEMTQMPEMVAVFNGFGGLASALVAMAEYWSKVDGHALDARISIPITMLIGMITLTGSLIAFGKLSGKWIPLWWKGKEFNEKKQREEWKAYLKLGNPLVYPGQHLVNLVLLIVALLLIISISASADGATFSAVLLVILAGVLGVLLTMPIGGADMPVVVSLLNSYSGLAACAAGFVLGNVGLIVSGSLVGASGLILTNIMCKAMNRSLLSVLAGGFGQESSGAGATTSEDRTVRQMDAEEAAMVLEACQKVFIIPGYGMAVAQAQHAVAEMADLLGKKGIEVRYGVHPVAGRMPGHMNVLLAEANVPYEQLSDLELNSEMEQCDAALIIGANDVVNPAARDDPSSDIAGMPIFEVDKARTVMVCKRSLNPGFAGIQNELFFLENTVMLFGDAKKMVSGIVTELKSS